MMVAAGSLIGYGNSIPEAYRPAGLQTGRLLGGVKQTDLPGFAQHALRLL